MVRIFLSVLLIAPFLTAALWAKHPIGVVTEVKGQVEVRRAGKGAWQPVRVNMPLYAGDILRTGANAKVVVWLPIGRAETLGPRKMVAIKPPKSNRDSLWRDVWSSFVNQMRTNLSEESLATVAAARQPSPEEWKSFLLLTPRNTRVLDPQVTFVWREVEGAQGYRLTVGIFDEGNRVWETIVKGTSFRYPSSAPALKPGKVYVWQVEAIGMPHAKESAWFAVAHPGEAKDIRFTLQQLHRIAPDPLASNLMAASLLESKGYYWDAISLLRKAIQQFPNQPEPLLFLAHLYDAIGLSPYAAEMRVKAKRGIASIRSLGWQLAATR